MKQASVPVTSRTAPGCSRASKPWMFSARGPQQQAGMSLRPWKRVSVRAVIRGFGRGASGLPASARAARGAARPSSAAGPSTQPAA
jgi:hypothetical protein